MMSGEAVEAAARGIFTLDQDHHMDRLELEAAWDRLPSETARDDYRYAARAALEAAAPYMLAAAWDEGQRAMVQDLAGTPRFGTPGYKTTPNPYRGPRD